MKFDFQNLPTEKSTFEYKESLWALPRSFWESVSAFANTNGGLIVLGVKEEGPQKIITGVLDPEKIKQQIFDTSADRSKINRNVLSNDSVEVIQEEDKQILIVKIKELPYSEKPLYLNNTFDETYIRLNTGDHRASKEDLSRMLRNSQEYVDDVLLDNYGMDDLDIDSILQLKDIIQRYRNSQEYSEMNNFDFLQRLGVFVEDRQDNNKKKLTMGGLLFLGKYQSIVSVLPHYHLDYFDRRGVEERWSDRIATGDLDRPNLNILRFYMVVLEKLRASIKHPFEADEMMFRQSRTDLFEALQEGLVNMLIHADYQDSHSNSVVEVFDAHYVFSNPGSMRLTKHEFFLGGQSKPRNRILTTLFRHMGIADRAGSGGRDIWNMAKRYKYRYPDLETAQDKTQLVIWNVALKDSFPDLSERAKKIWRIFCDEEENYPKGFTTTDLTEKLGLSKFQQKNALEELVKRELLVRSGSGSHTVYSKRITPLETVDFMKEFSKAIERYYFK